MYVYSNTIKEQAIKREAPLEQTAIAKIDSISGIWIYIENAIPNDF
jgi:hypothetical protein